MTRAVHPPSRTIGLLIVVGVILAGAVVWSNLAAPRPSAALAPALPEGATATVTPEPALTFRSAANGSNVGVDYELPDGLELTVREYDGYVAFTSGRTSLGFDSPSTARQAGLRILDVTTARPHFNNNRPLGVDAATFIDGLKTNPRIGNPTLGPVTAAELSGVPALSVDLLGPDDRVHLDGTGISIDLFAPSRLIVADFGPSIILVQVWAGAGSDFGAWLAEADALVGSLRIDVAQQGSGLR